MNFEYAVLISSAILSLLVIIAIARTAKYTGETARNTAEMLHRLDQIWSVVRQEKQPRQPR